VGGRWLPPYSLSRERAYTPPPPESAASEVEPLYPESTVLNAAQHPFGVPYAHRRHTMLIEPAIYLGALIRDFFVAGGKIVIREFAAARDLMGLREEMIFNCTGLGARALFGDQELIPVRGQLVVLLPQPEINYCTIGPDNIYMFPRRDGILLGGTFDRDVWNTVPDNGTTERILRDNAALFGSMRQG
jgi:glycine/D-amino acid oxidase-like deaminating enzyme